MNKTGKGGFGEHQDNINRKGTNVSTFAELRAAAIKVANEEVRIGGKAMPVYEAILRQWATSKNPVLQQAFINYAVGKVPDTHELTGAGGGAIEQTITTIEVIKDHGK
jgi:hypothetical protein